MIEAPTKVQPRARRTRIALRKIQIDEQIFPRAWHSAEHVLRLAEAIEAGAKLPPIVVAATAAGFTLIDGRHRIGALKHIYGAVRALDRMLDVEVRRYGSQAEMLLDAIRLNAEHGLTLSRDDIRRCAEHAERMEIDPAALASALTMKVESLAAYFPRPERSSTGPVVARPLKTDHERREEAAPAWDRDDATAACDREDKLQKPANAHQAVIQAFSLICGHLERGTVDARDEGIRYWLKRIERFAKI